MPYSFPSHEALQSSVHRLCKGCWEFKSKVVFEDEIWMCDKCHLKQCLAELVKEGIPKDVSDPVAFLKRQDSITRRDSTLSRVSSCSSSQGSAPRLERLDSVSSADSAKLKRRSSLGKPKPFQGEDIPRLFVMSSVMLVLAVTIAMAPRPNMDLEDGDPVDAVASIKLTYPQPVAWLKGLAYGFFGASLPDTDLSSDGLLADASNFSSP